MSRRLMRSVMLLWLAVVATSVLWDWRTVDVSVMALARTQAVSHYEKDLIYRRWVSSHGGVYVPPTDKTPPNPYLLIKERDITTTTGKVLTLVNPAYMTRQVHEMAAEQLRVTSHITSLKPIRPENAPDPWERQALLSFETDAKEAIGVETSGAEPYLRFMRPLATEASCLKCHAIQGYKIGDVRGGISVTVPYAPFRDSADEQHRTLIVGHGAIALLGLMGLWAGGRRLQRSDDAIQQSLSRSERLAAQQTLLLSSLGEGVYGVDREGRCVFINPAALTMLGFTEDEVIGCDQHQLFHYHKEDGSPYPGEACPIFLTLQDGLKRETEDSFVRKGGQMFPVRLTVAPMRRAGDVVGSIVVFQDITEKQKAEKQIHQLAYFDFLTNLPNRRMLLDRLDQAWSHARRHQRSLAVMFLDLDHFKQINDSLGHDVGDQLLIEVGVRLAKCVRTGDTVSRTGGDEFVIVLAEIADAGAAVFTAERIIKSFSEPVRIANHALNASASIGIAVFPGDGTDDVQALMKKADKAMYAAKAAGRNAYRFYAGD